MLIPYVNRRKCVRDQVDYLLKRTPYPLHFFEQKSDVQINRIYLQIRDKVQKKKAADRREADLYAMQMAEKREEERVNLRLASYHSVIADMDMDAPPEIESKKRIVGEYELTVANRRSIRFKFIHPNGRVDNAIVSRLDLIGFTMDHSRDILPPRTLCLAWESGKIIHISVDSLIAKITSSAANNPRELVQELYRIANSTKQSKAVV